MTCACVWCRLVNNHKLQTSGQAAPSNPTITGLRQPPDGSASPRPIVEVGRTPAIALLIMRSIPDPRPALVEFFVDAAGDQRMDFILFPERLTNQLQW